jgi:hypothetical protein
LTLFKTVHADFSDRLSTALALTLADDKIIDLLVRNLRAQADHQAQVS